MPRLNSKSRIPYGGLYKLELSDKGMVGSGSSWDMLLSSIRAYRKANAIPIGLDFENEVERELCEKYPAECDELSPLVPPRVRTLAEIIAGTRTLFAFKLAGSPLVSQEEANRRAQICVGCSHNLHVPMPCGSSICAELKQVVQELVGGKGTQFDSGLRECGICSCHLSAAVWMPTNFQVAPLSAEVKAQFEQAKQDHGCWKLG